MVTRPGHDRRPFRSAEAKGTNQFGLNCVNLRQMMQTAKQIPGDSSDQQMHNEQQSLIENRTSPEKLLKRSELLEAARISNQTLWRDQKRGYRGYGEGRSERHYLSEYLEWLRKNPKKEVTSGKKKIPR